MKLAIYTRVSTSDQTTDSQMHALKEYAARRGLEITHEYTDLGVSGSKDKRPGLNRLMEDARKKKFDGILVFRFDRFARSTKHLANALEEFQNLKIQFISYSENIDTSSPMGQAMFTMISAMSQLERDIIRERVKAGISAAKAKGTKLGRKVVVTEDIRRQIIYLSSKGSSVRSIAKELEIGVGSVQRALKEHETSENMTRALDSILKL